MDLVSQARQTARLISASDVSIYESLADRPDLFFPREQLEALLDRSLSGLNLDYPIRTRSKVVKAAICEPLGYPVPTSFKKTQPRFPGQNFDTYVQKANNLQIWNEEVTPTRRYVLIRIDGQSRVTRVRVVTGVELAALDTTGTLTTKFQASSRTPVTDSILVSEADTENFEQFRHKDQATAPDSLAVSLVPDNLIPIRDLFSRLIELRGMTISDPGADQERIRGTLIHKMAQKVLGQEAHVDTGQFPDVPDQLLEVKLQTSPTIDLGLVSPDSTEPLTGCSGCRHCDVRYAVFYPESDRSELLVNHLVLSTGQDFFSFFRKFGGLEVNRKIQLHLPSDFFGNTE